MKKGLFGGTFDPVHLGHIRIAEAIRDAFGLDEIVVIPSANPPHKDTTGMADAGDRLAMTRLAFAQRPGFSVSDKELRREGRSYTIDTVSDFLTSLPENDTLYLIMGLDAFLEIDTWKSHMALMALVPIIVIRRPVDNSETKHFESYLWSTISAEYMFSDKQMAYVHDTLQPVWFYQAPRIEISATQIRSRIKAGQPICHLVPPKIESFITKKDFMDDIPNN